MQLFRRTPQKETLIVKKPHISQFLKSLIGTAGNTTAVQVILTELHTQS